MGELSTHQSVVSRHPWRQSWSEVPCRLHHRKQIPTDYIQCTCDAIW